MLCTFVQQIQFNSMKLYLGKPKKTANVTIKREGAETKYLTFHDTSPDELLEHIYHEIMPGVMEDYSYEHDDFITTVQVREQIRGINGKSMQFSFEGVAPEFVQKKIVEHFGVDYQEFLTIKSNK